MPLCHVDMFNPVAPATFYYIPRKAISTIRRCSSKYVLLKFSKYSMVNTCVGVFFKKVTDLKAGNFIKKDPNTGVSCQYCEIFENTCFIEHFSCLLLEKWHTLAYIGLKQIYKEATFPSKNER